MCVVLCVDLNLALRCLYDMMCVCVFVFAAYANALMCVYDCCMAM